MRDNLGDGTEEQHVQMAWHHFAVVVTEPDASPDEVAVTTI